ncbi:MAG: DUF4174 domain-containing protein [Cyanobacteria bacterium J06642_11]
MSSLLIVGYTQPLTKRDTKNIPTVDALMDDHQWQDRVLLIFAPDVEDAKLAQQIDNLSGMGAGMNVRDLVVWQLVNHGAVSVNGNISDDLASQAFYNYFAVKESGFTVILVGKDGTEKLRRTQPITSNGLFSLIDGMPMRQREMRERGR